LSPADRQRPGGEITLEEADNHWAEIKRDKVTYRIDWMASASASTFRAPCGLQRTPAE
jgi:hypothetical protein